MSWSCSSSPSDCQPDQLLQRATAVRYQALFAEAGGLAAGNDVLVSGMKVGSVSERRAASTAMRWSTFTLNGTVQLGSDTTAHIRTGSLLGQRVLTLESAGSGRLHPMACHPGFADILAVLADRGPR